MKDKHPLFGDDLLPGELTPSQIARRAQKANRRSGRASDKFVNREIAREEFEAAEQRRRERALKSAAELVNEAPRRGRQFHGTIGEALAG